MYTTLTLTLASLKMFLRSRQALFFSLFMPMMILCIFGSINFDSPTKFSVGVVAQSPNVATAAFIKQMQTRPGLDVTVGPLDSELAQLNAGNRTIVLQIPDDLLPDLLQRFLATSASAPPTSSSAATPEARKELKVYTNSSKPMESQMALAMLKQGINEATMRFANLQPAFAVSEQPTSSKNPRYIEFLLPGIIAMSVMQMSVFSVAFVFARYRETGVIKRLLATPMLPSQFVSANIITRLIMSVSQASIFIIAGMLFFHIHVQGAMWLLALCVVLGALMFLGLGFTISGLAKTLEAVPVYSNLLVFPMLFLGNVFFSIANMPGWLHTIASFLPLTYFASALRGVMAEGADTFAIRYDLLGMLVWAVILVTSATLTFKFREQESV